MAVVDGPVPWKSPQLAQATVHARIRPLAADRLTFRTTLSWAKRVIG